MDIHTAQTILQLPPNSNESEIKRQYHKLALKYHPDKNKSIDANHRFQQVNEAYRVLIENNKEPFSSLKNYDDILLDLINLTYYNSKVNNDIFIFIKQVMKNYSKFSQSSLGDIPKDILINCYKFLNQNKEFLKIPEHVMSIINTIMKSRENTNNVEIVTPSLRDIFESNILKLNYDGNIYLIPLWHSELSFDVNDKDEDLEIMCIPNLPEHMSLDNDNNLHVYVRSSIQSLLTKKQLIINLEIMNIQIEVDNIKIASHQTIIFYGKGVPKIDEDNIYNNEVKGDIMIHIELY